MPLSLYKIKELEFLASGLRIEPDVLVEALLSLGFERPKQQDIKVVQKLTPEQKVKAIEEEALNKGWTYEQLWANAKWHDKRGLVYYVDDHTTVGEVTEKHISLIHEKPVGEPVILNFYNMNVEQRGIKKLKRKVSEILKIT